MYLEIRVHTAFKLLVKPPLRHKMQKITAFRVIEWAHADKYLYLRRSYIIAVARVFI